MDVEDISSKLSYQRLPTAGDGGVQIQVGYQQENIQQLLVSLDKGGASNEVFLCDVDQSY